MTTKVSPGDESGNANGTLREAGSYEEKADKQAKQVQFIEPSSPKSAQEQAEKPHRSIGLNLERPNVKQIWYEEHLHKARKFLKPVLAGRPFKIIQVVSLCFALFGGGLFTLIDVPDDPGIDVLDSLMLIVMVLFGAELVCLSIVDRDYPLSSFFWMDVLGTFSMIFEVSWLLGVSRDPMNDGESVDGALLRAVRATKVAARAGRLTKVLKCLSVMKIHRAQVQKVDEGGTAVVNVDGEPAQAKILSAKLMLTLSTKVSLLTVVLVLVVPLFQIGQYPEEDLSMRSWCSHVDNAYARAYQHLEDTGGNHTLIFRREIERLKTFYDTRVYYEPFKIEGYPEQVTINGKQVFIPGESLLSRADPARMSNVMRLAPEDSCQVSFPGCQSSRISWDFTGPNQVTAGMDIAMIFFIIGVMAAASANFTSTLDSMVVRPVEQILAMLKTQAANILTNFGEVDEDEDPDDDIALRKSETELLESIFGKLARLATLAADRNVASEAEMSGLDAEGKGVMMDMMHVEVRDPNKKTGLSRTRTNSMSIEPIGAESIRNGVSQQKSVVSASSDELVAGDLPVDRSVIESWELDILSLDDAGHLAIIRYIFFDSRLAKATGHMWTCPETFTRFHSVVQAGYLDQPYHNYHHATDVCHTTYRLLNVTKTSSIFADIDKHALLVAALCHDLGHQGKTNPFLIETKHDLALRYNDKSPLENMHCARLFEICNEPDTNVFENAGKNEHKQARKVCISTILHTDFINHVDMVRDISRIYEINSEICDNQAEKKDISPQYEELLQREALGVMEMFLHFADISNPLKPFPVCKAWAGRVIDEFFAQGDEEKELGLPVGMLNDRDKINRPGSQHGFISFLVAPLVVSAVHLCPVITPLSTQMASNLESWRDLWVEDAKPSAEDVAKRDAEVRKLQDEAERLRHRLKFTPT